jgi:hypothetical protein
MANRDARGGRWRPHAWVRTGLMASLAGTALLAAACAGGSHPAGSGARPSQGVTQKMATFASCMRSHGEPNFYYASAQSAQNSSTPALGVGPGYYVVGINPNSATYTSAMNACQHLLPAAPNGTVSPQQLERLLKFTQCMRAHGYSGYPDPDVQNGKLFINPLPASIDTTSPEFEAAKNACKRKS